MGTALMIVFVASIAAALALAAYGLRVLVGRWDRPAPFQAGPVARVVMSLPVVEPPAPPVQVVMAPPPVPYVMPSPIRGVMATPPPTPQRVARGSIAPAMSAEPRQPIEPPTKQVGPRFTVIKSSRTG